MAYDRVVEPISNSVVRLLSELRDARYPNMRVVRDAHEINNWYVVGNNTTHVSVEFSWDGKSSEAHFGVFLNYGPDTLGFSSKPFKVSSTGEDVLSDALQELVRRGEQHCEWRWR